MPPGVTNCTVFNFNGLAGMMQVILSTVCENGWECYGIYYRGRGTCAVT